MIEIRIYKEGRPPKTLGEYSPKDAQDILRLLEDLPIEDEDGYISKLENIHFDVGISPHIAVFIKVSR